MARGSRAVLKASSGNCGKLTQNQSCRLSGMAPRDGRDAGASSGNTCWNSGSVPAVGGGTAAGPSPGPGNVVPGPLARKNTVQRDGTTAATLEDIEMSTSVVRAYLDAQRGG